MIAVARVPDELLPPCKRCALGQHDRCYSVASNHPDDACGCYDENWREHEALIDLSEDGVSVITLVGDLL